MTVLYLCRHAIAEDPTPGTPDAERPLTPEGIRKFRRAARGFFRIIDPADITHILTSPLFRAQQTADILAQALRKHHVKLTPMLTRALGTSPSLPKILTHLRRLNNPKAVILVGHEPTLSTWIAQLCFPVTPNSPSYIELKKGAIAALTLDRTANGNPKSPTAHLRSLLPPSILRKL